jgi:hypothetical protein
MTDNWDEGGSATDDLDYTFDGEGYDSEKLGGNSGEVVDKEGWYHFEISDVKEELETLTNTGKEKSPCVRLDLTVMQSVDKQSPAGSRLYHRIYLASKGGKPPAEGSVKSALRFGIGVGLLKYVEKDGHEIVVDATTGSTRISHKIWQQAKGRQIVASVKLEKGDGDFKDKYAIPFGECYDPSDPKVIDVAKNADALAMIGKSVAPPSSKPVAAAPATNGASKPAAAPAPAGAAPFDDDLSDL